MIAVVFVCMSLHVFGCETEMVNALQPGDPETVGAVAAQVTEFPSGAMTAIAKTQPTPASLTAADRGESTTFVPRSTSLAHDVPPGLAADWESGEEMNHAAALINTAMVGSFELDQANTAEVTGLDSETATLAKPEPSEPWVTWTDQGETAAAMALGGESSSTSAIPMVD
jgi:hypothetical protein